ncbi:unnamed protein product [Schistosoma margrebowiei]|uniref:Uncharacterized protein n=1 Tax=Schistosoma margrebowiei TaxID=48269 RepID=A0A183MI10_9TREM|nr:unnamed protein product [Schistosoma margrebowiei]
MSDNVHPSGNEDDAIVMMDNVGRIFNDIMLSRRFTSRDNFETCLKEVHKYVISVCKKNSDDPTLKYFFVRYVRTYGRKRSSSESDACVQDVDDDSNNHSSEEHTTSNSPTQPRQRRRRRSSTYALLQMNLSFRSKYCHCQSGFWVRAVNDLFRHSSRWTRKYIMDLVLRALDNMSISTGSDDLLEKFINNYHSIHALSEPLASKLIRSCLEASEDICAQVMSSISANDEATTSESIVNTDHSYAS